MGIWASGEGSEGGVDRQKFDPSSRICPPTKGALGGALKNSRYLICFGTL
jgi:hypothetical protein